MVLKRKLPSTVGGSVASPAKQSEVSAAAPAYEEKSTPESAPVAPEPDLPTPSSPEAPTEAAEVNWSLDDLPEAEAPVSAPIAPEPQLSEPVSAPTEAPMDDMVMSAPEQPSENLVKAPSFGEDALESEPMAVEGMVPPPSMGEPKEESAADGWSIDGIASEPAPASFTPEPTKPDTQSNLPPWQQGVAAGVEPPILPGSDDEVEEGSKSKVFVGLALLAVLVGGVYYAFVEKSDKTTEKLARITNALEEVSEVPVEDSGFPEVEQRTMDSVAIVGDNVEEVVVEEKVETPFADFPAEGESLDEVEVEEVPEDVVAAAIAEGQKQVEEVQVEEPKVVEAQVTQETVVEFVDVPEEEVDELITGEEAPEAPAEMENFFERLRTEIDKAEQERTGEIDVAKDGAGEEIVKEVPKVVREQRNEQSLADLEAELAEYRRVLAGGSGETPKKVTPMEFFDGQVESQTMGTIPMPENAIQQREVKEQNKAASMYGANPYNLPVVGEPSQEPLQKVRTLDDFDVTMFVPEEKRIRMPKSVRPTFRASEFPKVYLLSLIPGQGIIAQNQGTQGALMIGESVEGWELVTVATQYAEFRKGKRRHVLTLNGIR